MMVQGSEISRKHQLMMDVRRYLREKKEVIEAKLDNALPKPDREPTRLHEAMRYTVFAGGKRLRSSLLLAVVETLGGKERFALPVATAIEMVHTASLILDDLPCMDDAAYRRGKRSIHLIFGEPVAILASMALLNRAFALIASHPIEDIEALLQRNIHYKLTTAIGSEGMIAGQTADLLTNGRERDFKTFEYIHHHKTGSLFIAATEIGGMLGGATEEEMTALHLYGKNIGFAFQVGDDILEVEHPEGGDGTPASREGSQNFVDYAGLEKAKRLVGELVEYAEDSLSIFENRGELLRGIAQFIEGRLETGDEI